MRRKSWVAWLSLVFSMVTKPMVQLSLLVRTARLIVSRWKRILLGAEENSSREKSVGLKWEVCVETGDCDGKFPFKPIPGANGGDLGM